MLYNYGDWWGGCGSSYGSSESRELKKPLMGCPVCTINSAAKPLEEHDSIKVMDITALISMFP
jgi:hypothetical protein